MQTRILVALLCSLAALRLSRALSPDVDRVTAL